MQVAIPSRNGIPLFGFGTFPLKGDDATRAVTMALEVGIRHIDTAQMYGNEADVGRATALVMQGNEIINSIDAQIAPYNPKSNSAPVAVDDRFLVVDSGQDGSSTIVSGDVLANDSDPDGDPLTAEMVSTPVSGTVEFNADGRFQYQANSGALITDSFTYYVSDGKHESNLATVTIMVIPLAEVVQVFLPIVQK